MSKNLTTLESEDLPLGWQKLRKFRRFIFGRKRKWDDSYISPDGHKFRSRVQLERFLQTENDPLSSSDESLTNNRKMTRVKPRSLKEKVLVMDLMRSFNSHYEDVYDPQRTSGILDKKLLHSNFSSTESLVEDIVGETEDRKDLGDEQIPFAQIVKEDTPAKYRSWLVPEKFCPNNNFNHLRFLHQHQKTNIIKKSCSSLAQSFDAGDKEKYKEFVQIVKENEIDRLGAAQIIDEEIEDYFSDYDV